MFGFGRFYWDIVHNLPIMSRKERSLLNRLRRLINMLLPFIPICSMNRINKGGKGRGFSYGEVYFYATALYLKQDNV